MPPNWPSAVRLRCCAICRFPAFCACRSKSSPRSALWASRRSSESALACCRFQLSVNALVLPALLLFLLLYLKSVALPPSKALFVFFTATMLVSFSATLNCYLCAPLELHNDQPVFTLPSGLISLALAFAVLLVFSLLFRRKIHWMLCNVSFSAIWRALFAAPLFLTLLGAFLFLCIWETRARYFFQFMMVLLCAGAIFDSKRAD